MTDAQAAAATGRSSLVTTMGGASGIIGACLYSPPAPNISTVCSYCFDAANSYSRVTRKTYDFDSVINGALAGLVSVTAGSVFIQPWAGIVLGLLGGIAYQPHCFEHCFPFLFAFECDCSAHCVQV